MDASRLDSASSLVQPRQRVRNHVNPLNCQYQIPAEPPNWEHTYNDLSKPFHLDIGTGSGRFLLAIAQQQPEWNYLGVEIRKPLVTRANQWRDQLNLQNVYYLFANINVTLPYLFSPGDVQRVSIQFPDPWFKQRHHKRRVVQPQLVAHLAELLPEGATVFLQSDIEAVAIEMAERFCEHPQFCNPTGGMILYNPLGIPTDRERLCQQQQLPIYRYWLERC